MRWLLLGLALASGMVESQEPTPEKPKQQRTEPSKGAQAGQRGTETLPFVVKTPEKTEAETKREEAERHNKSRNETWLAYSTIWLAVVTTALALFTFWLWGATRKLVIGSDKNSKRQLRAYVNVLSVKMVNVQRGQQVHIEFKNFGQTPAKNIRVWWEMTIRELQLVGGLERSTSPTAKHGVLAPSDLYTMSAPLPLFSDGGEVHDGKKALYVFGQLCYRDAFDEDRITNFQFTIRGTGWLSDRELYVCEEGNEAT